MFKLENNTNLAFDIMEFIGYLGLFEIKPPIYV